jgi:hypothetical protein
LLAMSMHEYLIVIKIITSNFIFGSNGNREILNSKIQKVSFSFILNDWIPLIDRDFWDSELGKYFWSN